MPHIVTVNSFPWFSASKIGKKATKPRGPSKELKHFGLGVGEWPVFPTLPDIAFWAVQSKVLPGKDGLVGDDGDSPTDHVGGQSALPIPAKQ
jgi:hypothetical protein